MNTLHLEVNDAGGWRRVMSFDARAAAEVRSHSTWLLGCADNRKLRARIIAPGTTAPTMVWTWADGWKEWRA